MTENDTMTEAAFTEPSRTAGEVEMLLYSLDRARAQFAWKCGDLDAEGLRREHPPTTMTLGGLLKHLALVEDTYTANDLTGEPIGAPWRDVDFDADPEWEWRTAADDSPADLYGLWRAAVARSRAAWSAALASGGLDQLSKRTPDAGGSPNLRRILVDLADEYARHVGHADLLREPVDGRVGEDPPR
jgi:uncharacterized damage-inducible protein DinB